MNSYDRQTVVERDLAYFLHLQSAYSFLDDDLPYGQFNAPYWDELVENTSMTGEMRLARLALIFAMGIAQAGNICRAFGGLLHDACDALSQFIPRDTNEKRLHELATQALNLAVMSDDKRDWRAVNALQRETAWVHAVAVRPYFEARSRKL